MLGEKMVELVIIERQPHPKLALVFSYCIFCSRIARWHARMWTTIGQVGRHSKNLWHCDCLLSHDDHHTGQKYLLVWSWYQRRGKKGWRKETVNLLEYSHTAIWSIYSEWCEQHLVWRVCCLQHLDEWLDWPVKWTVRVYWVYYTRI